MADNFNVNTTQDQSLIAGGLNPDNPAMTYVDFANQIVRNAQEQKRQEELVQQAMEATKQSKLSTKQKTEADVAGINPEMSDVVSKQEAVALLKANGMKEDVIQKLLEDLGDKEYVSRQVLQAIILKRGGASGALALVGSKEGQPIQGEDGKWYKTWQKRSPDLGLIMTDRVNENGVPVFKSEHPDEYELAKPQLSIQDPKLAAQTKVAGAKETLATARVEQNKVNNWRDLEKRIDPLTMAGTNAMAAAGKANQRADRAFGVLANPDVTWQQMKAVVTDAAGIFQGGVPPILSLEEQDVRNWQQKVAKFVEFVTGSQAEGLVPMKYRQQMYDLINEIKEIDNEIIEKQQNIVEIGGEDVIKKDPKRWERLKESVLNTGHSQMQDKAKTLLFSESKEGAPAAKKGQAAGGTVLPSGASYTVEE